MKKTHRYQLSLLLIAAVVMLPGLNITKLWDQDEGYFASTAAEMHAGGDWIVPTFNGSLFGHKPPWMYWMMMIGFHLFGTTEFAARFFSAVFGIASCWLTYHAGRRLFNAEVGWWAGLVMASCLMFSVVSRAATPDVYLTFFVTLALYLFAISGPFSINRNDPADDATPTLGLLPQRGYQFVAIYAVMGMATLVKGPIGFLFPMAVIGLFLLCMTPRRPLPEDAPRWRRWREALRPFGLVNFFVTLWQMRILTAIAVILLVAGPWYLAVGLKTQGAFLSEFFGVHHFQRFSSPMDNHSGPLVYYILSILAGMFPWSIFALPTLLLVVRQLRQGTPHQCALVFVTAWIVLYVGIFSLASTKLPNYILPAYPALAIVAAYFYQHWIDHPHSVHRGLLRIGIGTLPAVGLIALAGLPLAGSWRWNGQTLLDRVELAPEIQSHLIGVGLFGIPLLVGGIATLIFSERNKPAAAMVSLAGTSVFTMLGIWNLAAPQVAQYQANGQVGKAVHAMAISDEVTVAQFGYFPPSLAFYIGQHVDSLKNPHQASRFLDHSASRLLITTSDKYDQLKATLSDQVNVIGRVNRFPEPGKIVILHKAGTTAASTARQPIKTGTTVQ